MKDLLIRRAEPGDAELLAELAAGLSLAEGGQPPHFNAAVCRRDGFGEKPWFTAWIAEIEGRVAGYALHHPSYDTDRVVRAEWLGDLYVESWARNRGLGHILLRHVAKQGADSGGEAVHWTVLRRNEAARRFYRRLACEDPRLLHCLAQGDGLIKLAASPAVSDARLRPAEAKDAALLGRMVDELLLSLGEPRFGFDATERLLRDGFGAAPRFEAIIAERAGDPVGYALFWPIYDSELGSPALFLSDLMVRELARGRGIARDLMAEIARHTMALGIPRLVWEVLETNRPARAFYRKIATEDDRAIVVNCADENFQRLLAESL
jgi:ribosomal protein S18 acetylase RimI-like enzyme